MTIYNQISANIWKSWLIMGLFIVFATTVGFVIAKAIGYGSPFMIFVLFLSFFTTVGSYFFSDKLVLATSGAKKIKKKDNPELFRIVENLSIGDGVPMPDVYIINDQSPNAFATGRDPKHAAVAVRTGILERLNKSELEGVIAHELSHVKNYDTRLMGIVAILVGFIAILANMFMQNLWWGGFRRSRDDREGDNIQIIFLAIGILFAIISPIVATLIQLAISRKREFL